MTFISCQTCHFIPQISSHLESLISQSIRMDKTTVSRYVDYICVAFKEKWNTERMLVKCKP